MPEFSKAIKDTVFGQMAMNTAERVDELERQVEHLRNPPRRYANRPKSLWRQGR